MTSIRGNSSARPLPLSIDQIDTDWLTQTFQVFSPGARVIKFNIEDIIGGTCTKIRYRIVWSTPGDIRLPETVIIKGGFESHSRELDFILRTESLGYRYISALYELNTPMCYFADWDQALGQGIIIMEDLATRDVQFADPVNARTPDEISRTLTMLARYHARTWGFPEHVSSEDLSWVETAPPFSRPAMLAALEPARWCEYLSLPRGGAIAARFRDRDWAVAALTDVASLSQSVPNCIIHGDSHLGNVFFEQDGTPGFYDIVPRRAAPMSEVCYHMVFALDVGDRRHCERHLVQHYLDELKRQGVEDVPGLDEAMLQYGIFLAETFCIALVTDQNFQPELPITAYTCRASAALLDHAPASTMRTISRIIEGM